MMSIVLSSYRLGLEQPNDHVMVYEQHTDHIGEIYSHREYRLVSSNHDVILANHAIGLSARLLIWEKRNFERHLNNGQEPDTFSINHNSQQAMILPLIRVFASMEDAHKAIFMALWIQANLTSTQIQNVTNIAIKNKVVSRVTRLLSLKIDLEADNADIVEVR